MMLRYLMLGVALAALAGCDRPSAQASAPKISEPAASEAVAAAEAAAVWSGLTGIWAPAGACGDNERTLRLDESLFQMRDVRCSVSRLETIEGGVRAITQCTVGSEDDHVVDNFKFIGRSDDLTMINEVNDGVRNEFVRCRGDAQ
jgi:hypothetical protein